MKHPSTVEGYPGSLQDLARAIVKMRYDKVEEFGKEFYEALWQEARHDADLNHPQLSRVLVEAARSMEEVNFHIGRAWKLSEPHMRE